jgi:RNA polymerase sigma factor (sigma-70 family)
MDPPATQEALTKGSHARFHETRWTVVLAAVDPTSAASMEALAKLCRTYWYPLYAFARRSGLSHADAADVTQSFFGRLIQKEGLQKVDRTKGRFRSFLLAGLKNFMLNERDKQKAQKRGGGYEVLSLDEPGAEEHYQHEAPNTSAEQLYDLQWAVALVKEVVEDLRLDYAQSGKAALFQALEPYLTCDLPDGRLAEIAAALGMNPNTIKSALHRLRREEFGARLREQVRQTLSNPTEQEVREEIRHLLATLAL